MSTASDSAMVHTLNDIARHQEMIGHVSKAKSVAALAKELESCDPMYDQVSRKRSADVVRAHAARVIAKEHR
jgi:hypothetical protein